MSATEPVILSQEHMHMILSFIKMACDIIDLGELLPPEEQKFDALRIKLADALVAHQSDRVTQLEKALEASRTEVAHLRRR